MFANIKACAIPAGIALGFAFLYFFLPVNDEIQDFGALALGADNQAEYTKIDGRAVHCNDLDNFDQCMLGYKNFGSQLPVTLWLGNSQLHAINQFQHGDLTASPELHRLSYKLNKYFLTLSQPNASLQEHYLLFSYLLDRLPIESLVLPVVFDDTREDGIRDSLIKALDETNVIARLTSTKSGRSIINSYNISQSSKNNIEKQNISLQKISEEFLNENLDTWWPLWSNRSYFRGQLFNVLYQVRNTIFNIDPSSKRRLIRGRYRKNMDALTAILALAQKSEVTVVVYIVPLRNDVSPPYDTGEYTKFKEDVFSLSQKFKAHYYNFETLVPGKFWGVKNSTALSSDLELDFMHFKEEGHRLLAAAIFQCVLDIEKQ